MPHSPYSFHLETIFIWGFVATLLLTTVLELSRGLGFSRISLPFLLGTIFTANRHHAQILGYLLQFTIAFVFSFFYAIIFDSLQLATWWLGVIMGFLHGLMVLVILLPLLPHIHPRMASEFDGPDPTHMLEPPGFLGLNYGRSTPIITLLAHILFGFILGTFYALSK